MARMTRIFRPLLAVIAALSFFGFLAPSCGTETFREDFNGSSVNLTNWQPNWLGPNDTAITKPSNGAMDNCSAPSQNTVAGGYLWQNVNHVSCLANNGVTYPWKGAMVTSKQSFGGPAAFEFRANIPPASTGAMANWPALWTDGAAGNWPVNGEFDVAEVLSGRLCWAYHYRATNGTDASVSGCPAGDWTGEHTYRVEWNPNTSLTFVWDGVTVGTVTHDVVGAASNQRINIDNSHGSFGGPDNNGAALLVNYVSVTQ